MNKKYFEEYQILVDKLEGIIWAIDGSCDDIDCDKFMYRNLLKKRYQPVLEHDFSCMEKLKKNKETLMKMLSDKKYRKFRYEKCQVCNKLVDKLDDKRSNIVSFTRPSEIKGHIKCYEWKGIWVHRNCAPKVKIPEGWKKS